MAGPWIIVVGIIILEAFGSGLRAGLFLEKGSCTKGILRAFKVYGHGL